jgi:hypothetical protein
MIEAAAGCLVTTTFIETYTSTADFRRHRKQRMDWDKGWACPFKRTAAYNLYIGKHNQATRSTRSIRYFSDRHLDKNRRFEYQQVSQSHGWSLHIPRSSGTIRLPVDRIPLAIPSTLPCSDENRVAGKLNSR